MSTRYEYDYKNSSVSTSKDYALKTLKEHN